MDLVSLLRDQLAKIFPGKTVAMRRLPEGLTGINSDFYTDYNPSQPSILGAMAPSPTPTPTPSPTPVPSGPDSFGQVNPEFNDYYAGRNAIIEPSLFSAIMSHPLMTDFEKLMAFALATQESSGGYNLIGDEGNSRGPYHISSIHRPNISEEDATDPTKATDIVFREMQQNKAKGWSPRNWLKTWNYNSINPDYGDDIPRMATTSAFRRGR